MVPFPSLEWLLPHKSGPYELLIQHQPRSHHRAQYETEGSRGAVKTSNGGHPEVQVLLSVIIEFCVTTHFLGLSLSIKLSLFPYLSSAKQCQCSWSLGTQMVGVSDASHVCPFQLQGYQGSAPLGLQVFIGTADERVLKPHAFYQVHRVTGKTVATPSMERMMNGTKVLEILLEPKKHMKVV